MGATASIAPVLITALIFLCIPLSFRQNFFSACITSVFDHQSCPPGEYGHFLVYIEYTKLFFLSQNAIWNGANILSKQPNLVASFSTFETYLLKNVTHNYSILLKIQSKLPPTYSTVQILPSSSKTFIFLSIVWIHQIIVLNM